MLIVMSFNFVTEKFLLQKETNIYMKLTYIGNEICRYSV